MTDSTETAPDKVVPRKLTIRASGSRLGTIDDDGTISDKGGGSIGRVDKNLTIRSEGGSRLGKVDEDGTICGSGGGSIGRIYGDGTIRNESGDRVGKIDSDGGVNNASGSTVGEVEGYSTDLRLLVGGVLFLMRDISMLKV